MDSIGRGTRFFGVLLLVLVVASLATGATAFALVKAQAQPVGNLRAQAKNYTTTVTVMWEPPSNADRISVRLTTDARFGDGTTIPGITGDTGPDARGIELKAPAGAKYLVTVTTHGPGNSSAEEATSVVVVARATLVVATPTRGKLRRYIRVSGTARTGAASFPARGTVRVYRYWWNGKRWLLQSYSDVRLVVGNALGAASTFGSRYIPRRRGYWNFTVSPRYHLGFVGPRFVYSKLVRVT